MKRSRLIKSILTHEELKNQPPVLVDIGASGELHRDWHLLAPYSICIAFEPDDREIQYIQKESGSFKKLLQFNAVVTDNDNDSCDFYLTRSPYCSSSLVPDKAALQEWAFARLFEVEKKVRLNAISLNEALRQAQLMYIDWFKTDSQGTDLRLFQSLHKYVAAKVIVADYEPGILDAYIGEDKLYEVLRFMDELGFWLNDINVRGSQRISINDTGLHLKRFQKRFINYLHKSSPGWCEVSFMNSIDSSDKWSKRDLLLVCAIALLKYQYGFAIKIAQRGYAQYGDNLFKDVENHAIKKIDNGKYLLPFLYAKKLADRLIHRVVPFEPY